MTPEPGTLLMKVPSLSSKVRHIALKKMTNSRNPILSIGESRFGFETRTAAMGGKCRFARRLFLTGDRVFRQWDEGFGGDYGR
jgi:hypothetical protein